MEKNVYIVERELKNFRFYILHSHSIVHVLDFAMKSILTQQEIGCKNRGSRVAKVQWYDIEINSTKLVHRNRLCREMVEIQQQTKTKDIPKVIMVSLQDPWFSKISYFLTCGECLQGLNSKKNKIFKY